MFNDMESGERMIYSAVVDYRHCTVILYVVLSVGSDVMKVVIAHMIV